MKKNHTSSGDRAKGETDPKKFSHEAHNAAADAHEEAAVRWRYRSQMDGGKEKAEGGFHDSHLHMADHHDMRAIEHRHQAEIASHMKAGNITAAHEAAKKYSELPHGHKERKKEVLAHVERRLSKVPHNEAVAKDADMEGRHDVAQTLRRMKKSEPNVELVKATPHPFTKKPDMRGAQAASGQMHGGSAPPAKAPTMQFKPNGSGGHTASSGAHTYTVTPHGTSGQHQLNIKSSHGSLGGTSSSSQVFPSREAAGKRAMEHANQAMKSMPIVKRIG